MSELRLDDAWFINERRALLASRLDTSEVGSARVARALGRRHGHASDELRAAVERALGRLAPLHATAVRGHMPFFSACLSSVGLVPVDALVQSTVAVEWMWYQSTLKDFYRDHLAHVIKVATTAVHLLEGEPFLGSRLIDLVARGLATGELGTLPALRPMARRLGVTDRELSDEGFWRKAVIETARIAGLLHDLAYPSDLARKVSHHAEPSIIEQDVVGAVDSNHELVRLLATHLTASIFHQGKLPPERLDPDAAAAAEKLLMLTHSLRAGVRLLQFARASDAVWRLHPHEAFVLEWAALAATMHDLDKAMDGRKVEKQCGPSVAGWIESNKSWLRPSFRRDPVSYVIALADQLQDFGRIQYELSHPSHEASIFAVHRPVRAVKLEHEPGSLRITWLFDPIVDPKWHETKRKSMTETIGTDGWLDHEGLFSTVSIDTARVS